MAAGGEPGGQVPFGVADADAGKADRIEAEFRPQRRMLPFSTAAS
jgi:hypothetical protein